MNFLLLCREDVKKATDEADYAKSCFVKLSEETKLAEETKKSESNLEPNV